MNEAMLRGKVLELAVSLINNVPKKEGVIISPIPMAEEMLKFITTTSPIVKL